MIFIQIKLSEFDSLCIWIMPNLKIDLCQYSNTPSPQIQFIGEIELQPCRFKAATKLSKRVARELPNFANDKHESFKLQLVEDQANRSKK